LPPFQVQSLANLEEQQGIMTRVETIGVDCGGGEAGEFNGVILGVARAAMRPAFMRAEGTTFEGRS
jgi:hypothetical protein